MVGLVLAETRPLDFLEVLDDFGDTRAMWRISDFRAIVRQIEASTAITARTPAGQLVLIVGLLPRDDDEAWAWFAPGPALARAPLPALRWARRLLEFTCREIAPVTVKTFGAPGSVASPKLIRLFGFTATGLLPSPHGPITIWTRRF